MMEPTTEDNHINLAFPKPNIYDNKRVGGEEYQDND